MLGEKKQWLHVAKKKQTLLLKACTSQTKVSDSDVITAPSVVEMFTFLS
jgi:hypothetical protein